MTSDDRDISFQQKDAVCRICGMRGVSDFFRAREMFFGTREEFDYFSCRRCGCIQIAELPNDISRFYPAEYYGLMKPGWIPPRQTGLRRKAKSIRLDLFVWLKRNFPSISMPFPPHIKDDVLENLDGPFIPHAHFEILDVGSGLGARLLSWYYTGFNRLCGIDPYITESAHYENGVTVYRDWTEIAGREFDFAMMNHSLEHMPDQYDALSRVHRSLKEGRIAVIRIPISSCAAWKRYGAHWVQLDPPRHLYLHSIESLRIVATKVGFELVSVQHDSTDFQFWGSEQYTKNIPLTDGRSYMVAGPRGSNFTLEQIASFKEEATRLNKEHLGDQAVFYLRKLARGTDPLRA